MRMTWLYPEIVQSRTVYVSVNWASRAIIYSLQRNSGKHSELLVLAIAYLAFSVV